MNQALLFDLADIVERSATYNQDLWALLSDREPECKTPACVAGHCVTMHPNFDGFRWNPNFSDSSFSSDTVQVKLSEAYYSVPETAEQMLEISEKTAFRLFLNRPLGKSNKKPVTNAVAARVLRYLAITGKVNWKVTDEQLERVLSSRLFYANLRRGLFRWLTLSPLLSLLQNR